MCLMCFAWIVKESFIFTSFIFSNFCVFSVFCFSLFASFMTFPGKCFVDKQKKKVENN